jgi:hypothetical protein
MRNGFRVCDVDTQINPGAECSTNTSTRASAPRLPELAPYKVAIQSREVGGERHVHRFDAKVNKRTLGEAEPQKGLARRGIWRGKRRPSPGVQDDNAADRVHDMEIECTDRHFLGSPPLGGVSKGAPC